MAWLNEDRTKRCDASPAQRRIIAAIRSRHACRPRKSAVAQIQAPAPTRLIKGG
jgi:hypothetical protein